MSRIRRVISQEFKLMAVARFATSDNKVALAQELGVERAQLYKWHTKYSQGGAAALRTIGRPSGAALEPRPEAEDEATILRRRIAELERKVGQQELDLDFFRAALRQVEEQRRQNGGVGE